MSKKIDKNKTGYGNPPKDKQFKKGQSGNPKGRPPKTDTDMFINIFVEELNENVILHDKDGNEVSHSKKRMLIRKLINDAIKGKVSAQKQILNLGGRPDHILTL